jgi:hypothetical protein
MTFWESIIELRKRGEIPRHWTISDIRPHLRKRFSEGTILTTPASQSISIDADRKGSLVKLGRKAMALRIAPGTFELLDDPYRAPSSSHPADSHS